ncbi:putative transcription factor TIFY family [Helianthus debilis subsp. tardiflorus]
MSTANNRFPVTGKETSSFAKTCNRLSSFLKERGSLRDLGIDEKFDAKGKSEIPSPATENNTATVDLLSNIDATVRTTTENTEKTINNNLPEYVTLDSFREPVGSTNKSGSAEPETKSGQMTIFYGGKVIVLDCVTADKARDLVLAAASGSSSSSDIQIQNRIEADGSDLPIARRASLHRFLAKRKDRASVRAVPYQLHNPLMADEPLDRKFDLNL